MAIQALDRFSAMMRQRGAFARIHEYDVEFTNLPATLEMLISPP